MTLTKSLKYDGSPITLLSTSTFVTSSTVGFSGISIIFYRLFHIPIGFSTILLNIPVAILCYKLLGKKFFISSIRCMIVSSLIIDYVAPLFPVYQGDRLLAALCTGVFGGIGYAMIYTRNSSTGGSDFIIMAVNTGI